MTSSVGQSFAVVQCSDIGSFGNKSNSKTHTSKPDHSFVQFCYQKGDICPTILFWGIGVGEAESSTIKFCKL